MAYPKLPRSFYQRDNVVQIAEDLIGKVLCTRIDGIFTSGKIVETEAYNGRTDLACHARIHGLTSRTKIMFGEPGFAYIYLCYGIHHLFNVVTNNHGMADAVLIRGVEPLEGIDKMLSRRQQTRLRPVISNGPGKLSKALGITTDFYGVDLLGDEIWIEDRRLSPGAENIKASTRIGIDYAGEDALLPWRFTLKDSSWISK